jgi:hypothetical protein
VMASSHKPGRLDGEIGRRGRGVTQTDNRSGKVLWPSLG